MAEDGILFVGGSGLVGRAAARWFRVLNPEQKLLIGSRRMETAREAARDIDGAEAVAVDLDTPGLGLAADVGVSAVAVLAPDAGVNGLAYAIDFGIPYLNIGTGLPDVGPELAWYAFNPGAAPVLLSSHWMGGAAAHLAMDGASRFDSVRSLRVGTVIDDDDAAGPAALEDMERLHASAPATMAFADGRRVWLSGDAAKGRVVAIDGRRLDASAFSSFDVASLQAGTRAPDVRFDIASGVSSSRLRGGAIAIEIAVKIEGTAGGRDRHWRGTLEFDRGQASLTGLNAAISLSRLLGLSGGEAVRPGLYMPETLADPAWVLGELRARGAAIESALD